MASTGFATSEQPLCVAFDVALLDLDGVVYVGAQAVPSAAAHLAAARRQGMRLAFVTNNAARPPQAVAERLRGFDIPAEPEDVITSAQAAAHFLADRLPPGAAVLVVGTIGLDEALRERGLRPVHSAEDDPAAVVQGYSPTLDWSQLAEGAVAIRRGILWVATNLDPTVPSERGPLPGNGSLVAALRHATGAEPVTTGKPDPTMHRESVQRSGAARPVVVGDRLDTDIEGARAAGCPSLLVLTGVTAPADLVVAPSNQRPDFVADDVGGLLEPHRAPRLDAGSAAAGPWRAEPAGPAAVRLRRDSSDSSDGSDGSDDCDGGEARLDALRALCAAAWAHTDAQSAAPTAGKRLRWQAGDDRAEAMLASLHLS